MIRIVRGLLFAAFCALAAVSAPQSAFAEEAADPRADETGTVSPPTTVKPAADEASSSETVSRNAPAVVANEKSTVEAPPPGTPVGGKPSDGKTSTATPDVFVPSEDISEDLAVSLPVDI